MGHFLESRYKPYWCICGIFRQLSLWHTSKYPLTHFVRFHLVTHFHNKTTFFFVHVCISTVYFSTGGIIRSTLVPVRLMVTCCLLAFLVVTVTYSANLIAFLSVKLPVVPFNSLAELASHKEYLFGTQGGTGFIESLNVSRNIICNLISLCN